MNTTSGFSDKDDARSADARGEAVNPSSALSLALVRGWVQENDKVQESDKRRKEYEASVGDRDCPNCKHKLAYHCTRNLETKSSGCCPGYCFVPEECDCPGYETTVAG